MKKAVTKNDCQFSYLIKREEKCIKWKNLYTVSSGRCSPFPYVVTVLYHTNNDNCVTKTRMFSEFLNLLCVVINNVFENKFCKWHKLVGVALRPPPVTDKGSKALSEITSKRQYIYVQRIATIFQTGGYRSPASNGANFILNQIL